MFNKYSILSFSVMALLVCSTASAVNWKENEGSPWNRTTKIGPDAQVNGFYVNLGITGARAKLTDKTPKYLVIAYVFKDTPAHGQLEVGDLIVGANGKPFTVPHTNGYGPGKFGGEGPLMAFGNALGESQIAGGNRDGKLELNVKRGEEMLTVTLNVGTKYGQYSDTYPHNCKKTDLILKELYEYIASRQNSNGSFPGGNHVGMFAALALLASDDASYLPHAKRFAQYIAKATDADHSDESSGLPVWKYTFAGIYLCEYYLATGEKWVLPELEEVRDWLIDSQFIDPKNQLRSDRAETKKPGHVPRFVGGWGHNPYYEGYGPMSITTSQAAMALALMHRCGIKIDDKRLAMAYDFLADGTNNIGYVWYNSVNAGNNRWADMGRTGSTALANFLAPYEEKKYMARAWLNTKCIHDHPKSFPDTHGCPPLGMAWTALAANLHPAAFKNLMTYHKWWFNLAQCPDQTFVAQPNRDAGGSYTSAPRLFMSSVVALIFSTKYKKLRIMGAKVSIKDVNPARLSANTRKPFALLEENQYAKAHQMLKAATSRLQRSTNTTTPSTSGDSDGSQNTIEEDLKVIDAMLSYIDQRVAEAIGSIKTKNESPDVCKLKQAIDYHKKTLAGIAAFNQAIAPIEKTFREEPRLTDLRLGKSYYKLREIAVARPGPTAIKAIKRFAERNKDHYYGKLAESEISRLAPKDTAIQN